MRICSFLSVRLSSKNPSPLTLCWSRNLDKSQTRKLDKKPLKQTYSHNITGTSNAKETLGNNNHLCISNNYVSISFHVNGQIFIPSSAIYISSSIFYQIPASQSEKAISNYKELGAPFQVEVIVPNQPSSFYQEINHIYYRIDQGTPVELTNVTISQSTSFSDNCTRYSANGVFDYPEDGNHTLTVYTQGTKEQITDTGDFVVPRTIISSQPTQSANPNPFRNKDYSLIVSLEAIGTIGLLTFTSFGLLVYFKRRKDKP